MDENTTRAVTAHAEVADANIDQGRRAALRAIAKYSGAAGAASLTLLTAQQALAQQGCSRSGNANACK